MATEQRFAWALRAVWALVPVVAGPGLAQWGEGWHRPVQLTASGLLWVGWAAALLATMVPHPLSLTVVRLVAPAAVGVAIASADAAAVLWSTAACALAFAPAIGVWAANGIAYPNERRFLLRPPGPLLIGPIPLAAAGAVAGAALGPMLLAARQWLIGAVALVVGWGAVWLLGRALYRLTRRWLVFVPAGVVLHDDHALADPVLFRKADIETLAPADAGTDALDLTLGAPGLAVELVLAEPTPLVLARPGAAGQPGLCRRLLVTPTRPGAVLAEARRRGIA